MRIAIVGGTGGLGYGLAVRLAHAGQDVVIGSRSADRAQAAAHRVKALLGPKLQGSVEGGANAEVVKDATVVMVTVPFPGQADTYKAIKSSIGPNTTVIDCTVPLASEVGGRPTRMLGVWEGSAAQQARSICGRDLSLASGFHTSTRTSSSAAIPRPARWRPRSWDSSPALAAWTAAAWRRRGSWSR
jgi:NADPH-dependent F420 reductase